MKKILGFNATKEENLQIWEDNAACWHASGPPWRPSKDDIRLYQKLAGEKLRGSVLILGSTPELRDLAGRFSSRPTLVDISPSMIYKMATLLTEANPSNEVWVKADWLDAPFPANFFDAILGDMPWWVLSVGQQHKLRDKAAELLKPDGILVTRIRIWDSNRKSDDMRIVLKKYLEKLDSNPDQRELVQNIMVSHLHDITADEEKKQIDRAKTKKFLLESAECLSDPGHKAFVLEASAHLLSADWTSQTREELLAIIGKKFHPIAELYATDYDSEWYPTIAFKKNA